MSPAVGILTLMVTDARENPADTEQCPTCGCPTCRLQRRIEELERDLCVTRRQVKHWKANHRRQVWIKQELHDRYERLRSLLDEAVNDCVVAPVGWIDRVKSALASSPSETRGTAT